MPGGRRGLSCRLLIQVRGDTEGLMAPKMNHLWTLRVLGVEFWGECNEKGSAMRRYLFACVALVMALAVAGCGSSKNQAGNTASKGGVGSSKQYAELRWGMLDWQTTALEALKNPNPAPYGLESLVTQYLVEFEADGKVKPGLASSIEQPNPTTYVYNLKSGVKFSNGHPLTVADVVYSLDRDLAGKEAWTRAYWGDVASISARGSSAVVIKLKQPSAIWEDIVAFTSPIIEKAQAQMVGEKALGLPGKLPIGSGPWEFSEYKPEVSVQLVPNPYWKGAKRPARKISISLFKTETGLALALRSGAIDGASFYQDHKIFANIPGVRQVTAPGDFVSMLDMNTTRAPFNDVHVRRAVAYATNTNGIIKALYAGTATEDKSIVPVSLFANLGSASEVNEVLDKLPKYDYSLSAAKRELAKSAYPHGFSTEIEVEAINSSAVSVAEIVASELAKIGITAKVHEMPESEAATVSTSNKVTLFVTETGSVYPDPEGMMSTLLPASQIGGATGLNEARYDNAEVNKLLTEESATMNTHERLQLIGKLLSIVGSDVPYVPVFTPDEVSAISEKYVDPTFSIWTSVFRSWALGIKLAH
jgi:peptide/nickel transport system substrate-binding protein